MSLNNNEPVAYEFEWSPFHYNHWTKALEWKDPRKTLLNTRQIRNVKPLYHKPVSSEIINYVLQDDECNRLTPRIVDIAYSAFMRGATWHPAADGGQCDWFNDTRPMVMKAIEKIRARIEEDCYGNGE